MPYSVKILKDSIAPCGKRLTTFELTYPRIVHAELMTHRMFSRNSASSRAIPTSKLIRLVEEDPAMPLWWGKNQSGMQAYEELNDVDKEYAATLWLEARNRAVLYAKLFQQLGLHKQLANRVIEPWMFITVIVSATEYDQWFAQRRHKDAQPEIKWVADHMFKALEENTPTALEAGEWHMPFINQEDKIEVRDRVQKKLLGELEAQGTISSSNFSYLPDAARIEYECDKMLCKISVGRCARVSYLTHDGVRDIQADIDLHDRLMSAKPGHWSPFEHVAQALSTPTRFGNFSGFYPYRKMFKEEDVSNVDYTESLGL
jgi:thymidylate synthase ThyX